MTPSDAARRGLVLGLAGASLAGLAVAFLSVGLVDGFYVLLAVAGLAFFVGAGAAGTAFQLDDESPSRARVLAGVVATVDVAASIAIAVVVWVVTHLCPGC